MSIPTIESCAKRKRTPKLFGSLAFGDSDFLIKFTGLFRDNIRLFLRQCGELEDYSVEGMPIWCTFLVYKSATSNAKVFVPLYTIEETVAHSPQLFCVHCRRTGWSNHSVSKRKYHVIIPNQNDWSKHLKNDVLDTQKHNHLLHGLIHCNEFGHLLCINGIERGSKYLRGREIMDLWDRICTILRPSVEDTSKKKSMDFRLLHGVAYGHPWFGRWGYIFYHGSFGVAEHHYDKAIEILGSLELDKIIQDFGDIKEWRKIKEIIQSYRDMSETQLITLKVLFRVVLFFKYCTPAHMKSIMANNEPSLSISEPSKRTSLGNKSKDESSKYRKFTSVIADVKRRSEVYIYKNLLLNYENFISQVILDSKHFVKEWPLKDEQDQVLRFMCQIISIFIDQKSNLTPGELVMVPLDATILELKKAIETALRDTYCIMEKVVVTGIEDVGAIEDGELVFGAIKSGAEIIVRGNGIDLGSKYKYEGGDKNLKVKCECGAEDDDGERMVACEICNVCLHTRCHGIQESETMRSLFVCPSCGC